MAASFSGSLASVDGSIMLASGATIPATDEGLLRGDGAFEVIRIYDGQPFALEDHLAGSSAPPPTSGSPSTLRRFDPTPIGCSPTPARVPITSCCGSW